ncbi:MAG TPA: Ppx/GppA phosphatase family protein [Solirubrobacteraceae bacterium]|nr:Ppx/GppA phosphatase family protein [Solirubrobacteraceae bacterium]
MRIAVADIGTNSTRLLVAELEDGRVSAELERESEVTRLGRGVDAGGALSQEGMERVAATLEAYQRLVERHGVERRVAVLTSAVRDATNGREFAQRIRDRFGFEPHILSGDDEARFTFLGATSERAGGEEPTLVIDIGGGSTETVIGIAGREPDFHVSNQAGVVRQTERHIHHDPPRRGELEALAADVRAIFLDAIPAERRRAIRHAIAVAGTATSLGAIAQELDPYDPERVHGYRIARAECERILGRLAAIPLQERRRVKGLHPDRAPTIVAGVVILLEVLDLFGLGEVEVSEHDILRGAALALAPPTA